MSAAQSERSLHMSTLVELSLNSFVRRTHHTSELKELLASTGAKLSRSGRSRNWLLKVSQAQTKALITLLRQSDQESWSWIAKLLEENKLACTYEELLVIVNARPSITVTELMSKTDCTLKDARQILDQMEWG